MAQRTLRWTRVGLPARRSGRYKYGLEGVVGEPDGPGEGGAVLVDHGDGVARRERPSATRRVGADFVEVDDPKAGQRGERLVEGQVRVTPALMVTAGGNPVSTVKLIVCDVVSLARKYAAVPAGLVSRHREPLITSPGRTGRLTSPTLCAQIWQVTFCAESTVISTWTSSKPRPTKVWK